MEEDDVEKELLSKVWETEDGQKQKLVVLNYLQELGCCSRCTLRLMLEKNYKNFMFLGQVIEQIDLFLTKNGEVDDLAEPPAKKPTLNHCLCCLGLLQDGCNSNIVEQVISEVKQSGHEFKDFVLQLQVPPTIELREYLLVNHLKEKFSSIYTPAVAKSIATVRDVWKYVFGPQIGRTFGAHFTPFSSYSISVLYSVENFENECKKLTELAPQVFRNLNRKKKSVNEIYSRAAVLNALDSVKWDKLKCVYEVPPAVPEGGVKFDKIICHREQIYLAGRYNKYSRKLCQTPWFVEGEKRMENSVEELIVGAIKRNIICDKIVFSSSGREDVDVRMLGEGRPFVLELFNPRRIKPTNEEFTAMQNEINCGTKDIAVRDLQLIEKDELQLLKQGEEMKKKTYSALCCCKRTVNEDDMKKLSEITDLVVQQKTPIRVLHRRNVAIRPKIIHSLSGTIISDQVFKLVIVTQAGTYVKEFVHGDLGRTIPNLGTLLDSQADIMALDVERVEIDWPPKT